MFFFSGGIRESDIIKQAIVLATTESSDAEYVTQTMLNLRVCIKNGNCELLIKSFKYVILNILNYYLK